ncbi:MAG: DUF427 domain-containing protein [Solirubrobacteraceae bacterium]
MTLTVGTGPLGAQPNGRANYTIDGPEHRLLLEDYPLRLRAVVGGEVVLDSTRACILHETGSQVVPYVPLADFDERLLTRTRTSTRCPFKGEASCWSVNAGGRTLEDAVWAYEQPLPAAPWMAGLAALGWKLPDAWYVEDEPAFGPHLLDPYHRVDVFQASRTATVTAGGRTIARTSRPKLLFETILPVRVYIPRIDIEPGVLIASDTRTQCPYKGQATYFDVCVDGDVIRDGAWTYETPLPGALQITNDVCFLADGIDVRVEPPADAQSADSAAAGTT